MSTLSAVEREMATSNQIAADVITCEEMIDKLCQLSDVINADVTDVTREELSNQIVDFGIQLESSRERSSAEVEKITKIRDEWIGCEQDMMKIDEWIRAVYDVMSKLETSQDGAEELFQKVRVQVGMIAQKEVEIANIEARCDVIEGVETPSTLDANLANLRTKWQQVS